MISKVIKITIVKEILKYSPSKIISILVGIFSFKFYTDIFSVNEYGIYNLILSTFSLITVFLTGWMGYVLIRFFEKHKSENTLNEFLSTIITILIFIIAVLFIIGIPIVIVSFNSSKIYFLAFLSLPLTIVTSLLSSYYQLNQEAIKYNIVNIASGVGVFVLFFLLYYCYNTKLTGFFLATNIVNLGLLFIALNDFKNKQLIFHINKKLLLDYLRYGLPQVGTGIGVVLLSVSSRYFIQYFKGTDAVGIFSAAFKFGELSILLPLGIFTGIFSPYIFREFEISGKEMAYIHIYKYKILYIFFFGPIFILLYTFPLLPMVVLGDNFKSSLSLIPIVCFGNFLFGYTQFLALYCQIDFKPYVITLAILASVVVSIFLNFLLIPEFGILGAAYSTVFAYLVYIILLILLSKINTPKIPFGSFVALTITAIIYWLIVDLIDVFNTSLWVKIILGTSIWFFLFVLMILFKQFKLSTFFDK